MKVLQVKKFPIYDIFFKNGWYNWVRVSVQRQTKQNVSTRLLRSSQSSPSNSTSSLPSPSAVVYLKVLDGDSNLVTPAVYQALLKYFTK